MTSMLMAAALAAALAGTTAAQESRSKGGEHPGAEHPGTAAHEGSGTAAKPRAYTAKEIKAAMRAHVAAEEKKGGGFLRLHDDHGGGHTDWVLKFKKIHDPVRIVDGHTYFACVDFRAHKPGGAATRDVLDVDFWLRPDSDGTLKVVETRIHKVNKKPRFTYDGNEIVPLEGDTARAVDPSKAPKTPAAEGSAKESSGVEHPGAEHPGTPAGKKREGSGY